MLPASVESNQEVSSDSSVHKCLHDAHVLFSWEGGALVDHIQFYPDLVIFSQRDLIHESVARPLQVS